MNKRMIFHNLPSLISVGAEVDDNGLLFVAFAACNRRDQPQRKWATSILNARLDAKKSSSSYFLGVYSGEDIGADVFGPIRDSVRNLRVRRNVKSLVEKIVPPGLVQPNHAWLDSVTL